MNLSVGSTGDGVKLLQTALFTMGYDIGSSGVDGIFGPDTLAAVKQFQQDHGLTVDGIVGSETAAALSISLSGMSPAPASSSGDASQPAASSGGFLKWLGIGAGLWWLKRKLF